MGTPFVPSLHYFLHLPIVFRTGLLLVHCVPATQSGAHVSPIMKARLRSTLHAFDSLRYVVSGVVGHLEGHIGHPSAGIQGAPDRVAH
jgi:hypothetical protein